MAELIDGRVMGKKAVYVETTVVSCLTARPASDLVRAACQKITVDWWETQRRRFDLHAAEVTVSEAGRRDAGAGGRRLAVLADVALLPVTTAAVELSKALGRGGAVPEGAENDALHVAVAAVHGVDYLLTWNWRHLNNAETKPVMRKICREWGYVVPEICTPQQLMGGAAAMADEIIEEVWRIKDEIFHAARPPAITKSRPGGTSARAPGKRRAISRTV